MPGNMVLNPDFKEFFQLLNANFESLGLQAEDFLEADTVIQLGFAPNRIDLIMGVPGVDFEECYPLRIIEEVDGVQLAFIDLENLVKTKRASGRLQDLADIENLG